jgi:hypothetical protein
VAAEDTDGSVLEHGIMAVDTNFLLRTFLPGDGGREFVRLGIETVERLRDKRLKNPLWCVSLTRRTANSAGSGLISAQISGFGENPFKYTDPDGKEDKNELYGLSINEGESIQHAVNRKIVELTYAKIEIDDKINKNERMIESLYGDIEGKRLNFYKEAFINFINGFATISFGDPKGAGELAADLNSPQTPAQDVIGTELDAMPAILKLKNENKLSKRHVQGIVKELGSAKVSDTFFGG